MNSEINLNYFSDNNSSPESRHGDGQVAPDGRSAAPTASKQQHLDETAAIRDVGGR